MTSRSARFAAVALACALPLSACGGSAEEGAAGTETPLSVTTPTAPPQEDFQVEEVDKLVSDELTGEPVDDPAMELSYKWQGASSAPNGGSVLVVAVTNKSEVPMPADALKQPTLSYTTGGNNKEDAAPLNAEESGVDIIGLDEPLRAGATVNAKYAFDVAPGRLWDADFTIGNVTFSGNLNG
ncbi:hypothetical protein M3F30_02875 [Corynebacterium sanguinis]|uniref:hypothetical protein n=1 Tax=Corynebacterium sanguinis TaxID=2594913 RepID=UPI0011AA246A|nr:hypothetical protein [Corynebacterium sanguinis]MCT2287532.1 hypothetical protein [Corynebacterium sanguinis]